MTNWQNIFYKNSQRESNHNKVLENSAECARQIFEAKKNDILEVTNKPNIAPKSYCFMSNRLLYNKKTLGISPLLVDDKFASNLHDKIKISYQLSCNFLIYL